MYKFLTFDWINILIRTVYVNDLPVRNFCLPVCVLAEELQRFVETLLDSIQSGLVHNFVGKAVGLKQFVIVVC